VSFKFQSSMSALPCSHQSGFRSSEV